MEAEDLKKLKRLEEENSKLKRMYADLVFKSSRVIWVLRHLVHKHGKSKKIRMDNGPEFFATIAQLWSAMQEIEFKYIQPGKPTQNAYIERFNKTYRQGVLDAHIFETLDQVRDITQLWMLDYNEHRPHDALNGLSPVNYRTKNFVNMNKYVKFCSVLEMGGAYMMIDMAEKEFNIPIRKNCLPEQSTDSQENIK